MVFTLSPLTHAEGDQLDLQTALSASSRSAEPPRGVPYALIEHIGLTLEFSRYEAQNLENGVRTEQHLLETLHTQNEVTSTPCSIPELVTSSTQLYEIDDCPELYRDFEQIQDIELLSLSEDDKYYPSSLRNRPIDICPHRPNGDRQTEYIEVEDRPLGSIVGKFDSTHILRLASAGMQSMFCNVGIRRASGVQLSNELTRLKLCNISPVLFSPGYNRVCFSIVLSVGAGYISRIRVTVDRCFHTIIIFLATSPVSRRRFLVGFKLAE